MRGLTARAGRDHFMSEPPACIVSRPPRRTGSVGVDVRLFSIVIALSLLAPLGCTSTGGGAADEPCSEQACECDDCKAGKPCKKCCGK